MHSMWKVTEAEGKDRWTAVHSVWEILVGFLDPDRRNKCRDGWMDG